jgi:SAM-dependent methyltransferase
VDVLGHGPPLRGLADLSDAAVDAPWEHPDWYDLHDTTWTAGPEREPEHYRELVLALPPLDATDHLIDVGAGTGKLAALVARGYPRLGRVTLIEPNRDKLERARGRLEEILPSARVEALGAGLGSGDALPRADATAVTVGSVLMPIMELRGGTLADGLEWLRRALGELVAMLRPGGWLYDVETLAPPWARGPASGPVRRLDMAELTAELARAGAGRVECVYRFRDRVILKARRAP